MKYDVKDLKLADKGKQRIEWADHDMPVLRDLRARFKKQQPMKGMKMSACLHVTAETANLMRTLKAAGADVVLCASNPLSTQDDVAAALVKHYGIPTFAITGADNKTYYKHLKSAVAHSPNVTMDDGADLVTMILKERPDLHSKIVASMEETTTGVIRLRAMEKDGVLKFPVVAVNDAKCKHFFDNRYGTGQSTIDGIIRASDVLLAGSTFVVAGYGWCGRGLADRARGMGAKVIVTEVDPVKALEAVMDGFRVMPMVDAAKEADIICTVTGNVNVLDKRHFKVMKDGAMICNSGHFNVEINLEDLKAMSKNVKRVREFVEAYHLKSGKTIHVLGEGRLVNLAAAEGHPASVMDMSFAVQALTTEWAVKNHKSLTAKVYNVPEQIDDGVSRLKLKTMGVKLELLTPEQKKYLASWEMGT
ncbi:MAG: adenosylhomocysteinase [Candidatus Kerfeldbacteria bacterium]|nr:adenosylhomocysteinase [Candidatus Kerfeldbacteria bacterium]